MHPKLDLILDRLLTGNLDPQSTFPRQHRARVIQRFTHWPSISRR
jgi:hypothetical protein